MKYLSFAFLLFTLLSCGESGLDVNIFPVSRDLEIGRQTAQEISNNPQEFPILSKRQNPRLYNKVQGMVDDIVRAGNVPYADLFPYEVTIIDQDVKNAFAVPGGYIYVYTGLINFLRTDDQLAGVLAHEVAHVAERHSTDQLTSQYGVAALLSILTGGGSGELIGGIAGSLINLRFGRSDESEADALSVRYLCRTKYDADGAAGFFEMTQDRGGMPEFLSTHPNPANRVTAIRNLANQLNCSAK